MPTARRTHRITFDSRQCQPGTPVVFATNLTPDDFTFDELGNLYVATEPSMSVVRIHPGGTQETIASAADGLQNTTAVLFGRHGNARLDLYILSAQIPSGTDSRPGVYVLHGGLPGLPVSILDRVSWLNGSWAPEARYAHPAAWIPGASPLLLNSAQMPPPRFD